MSPLSPRNRVLRPVAWPLAVRLWLDRSEDAVTPRRLSAVSVGIGGFTFCVLLLALSVHSQVGRTVHETIPLPQIGAANAADSLGYRPPDQISNLADRFQVAVENQRIMAYRLDLLEVSMRDIQGEFHQLRTLLITNLVAAIMSLTLYVLTHYRLTPSAAGRARGVAPPEDPP